MAEPFRARRPRGGLGAHRIRVDRVVSTPRESCRPLIVISGFAWFLGTLAGSDIGLLAIVGALALTIHRGPLMHAIVGYPTGRVLGRMSVAVVIAAYAYAVVVPLTRDDVATILIATTLVASTIWTYYRSTGPQRQARRIAVVAAAVLAMPLLTGSIGRLAGAGPDLEGALNWIYPAAVAGSGSSWRPTCRAADGRTPR